jgi:hypothetical protein
VIVAGLDVAFMQIANPWFGAELLIVVFAGSEVDHVPILSATKGQLPLAEEETENCARFPGALAAWSAVAVAGATAAVIAQLLSYPPQLAKSAQESRPSRQKFIVRLRSDPF